MNIISNITVSVTISITPREAKKIGEVLQRQLTPIEQASDEFGALIEVLDRVKNATVQF